MIRKTRTSCGPIKALVAALTICAANTTWFIPDAVAQTNGSALGTSPCAEALAQRAVCRAASQRALEIIAARQLNAITVVQDVRTGAVVAVAASRPSELDVTTPIRPLSL